MKFSVIKIVHSVLVTGLFNFVLMDQRTKLFFFFFFNGRSQARGQIRALLPAYTTATVMLDP